MKQIFRLSAWYGGYPCLFGMFHEINHPMNLGTPKVGNLHMFFPCIDWLHLRKGLPRNTGIDKNWVLHQHVDVSHNLVMSHTTPKSNKNRKEWESAPNFPAAQISRFSLPFFSLVFLPLSVELGWLVSLVEISAYIPDSLLH